MNTNYIYTQDADSIARLKKAGFILLSEKNGIAVFLNDPKKIKTFSNLIVTYTNKMNFGG